MKLHIEFDTESGPDDYRALAALVDGLTNRPAKEVFGTPREEAPAQDFPTQSERHAAAKKQEAKKPAPKVEEKATEPVEEKTPEPVESPETESSDYTFETVHGRAAELLAAKQGAVLKAALDVIGVGRVSELNPDQYAAFMNELPKKEED